jgi:hypothetical protein
MKYVSVSGFGVKSGAVGAVWALVLALGGCVPPAIEGKVYNHRGEELPGVAVLVEGADRQEVTDSRGRYRIAYTPGDVVLRFTKSGFTPGRIERALPAAREVQAAGMTLWQLPISEGVHILQDDRYVEVMALEPEPYVRLGGEPVYGTTKWTTTTVPTTRPLLLCFKMPRYGLELCKLTFIEARPANDAEGRVTTEIWAKDKPIPTELVSVDQPEEMLLIIDYEGTVEPGAYAVHWGALDGVTEAGPRAFFFTVTEDVLAAAASRDDTGAASPEGGGE